MADQQYPFGANFANVQQNVIPNQFSGGQFLLSEPSNPIPYNQTQFTMDTTPANSGMINIQNIAPQPQYQQPMQPPPAQHLFQQQQNTMQQQQTSQNNEQSNAPKLAPPPPPTQTTEQKSFLFKETSLDHLHKAGQKTVREIVNRWQEFLQFLRAMQPPNGTSQGMQFSNEKKAKMQELIKGFKILFSYLRAIYNKFNESYQLQGMEYTHIESLIPLKEEWDVKTDTHKTSEGSQAATCEETKELIEQITLKNRHLKEIINHLRRTISEVNTMMCMRRT